MTFLYAVLEVLLGGLALLGFALAVAAVSRYWWDDTRPADPPWDES
jgi:hypothetical protein